MADKWVDLFLGSAEDRLSIDPVDVEIDTQECIENLVKATIGLNHIVNFNAKCIADRFKLAREAAKANNDSPKKDKTTSFRLRVRMSDKHTLMAEWYRTKMSFGRLNFDNKSRNRKYSYPASTFYGQPAWVQDFARQAEAKLGVLRKQNEMLFIIRKNLYELSKMVAEYHRIAAGNNLDDKTQNAVSEMLSEFFVEGENKEMAYNEQKDLEIEHGISDDNKKIKKAKDVHDRRRITGEKMLALLNQYYPELTKKKNEDENEED